MTIFYPVYINLDLLRRQQAAYRNRGRKWKNMASVLIITNQINSWLTKTIFEANHNRSTLRLIVVYTNRVVCHWWFWKNFVQDWMTSVLNCQGVCEFWSHCKMGTPTGTLSCQMERTSVMQDCDIVFKKLKPVWKTCTITNTTKLYLIATINVSTTVVKALAR